MNYKIRTLKGLREHIESGMEIDTVIAIEPDGFGFYQHRPTGKLNLGQANGSSISPSKRTEARGNVVQYEVEYHKRVASSVSPLSY